MIDLVILGGSSQNLLVLHAAPHHDARARDFGLTLDHPHPRALLGAGARTNSVLPLRRAASMRRSGHTVAIPGEGLTLGIGLGVGTGRSSALGRTLDRLAQYGFLRQSPPWVSWTSTPRFPSSAPAAEHRSRLGRAADAHLVEQHHRQVKRRHESEAGSRTTLARPLGRTHTSRPTGLSPAGPSPPPGRPAFPPTP